MHGGLAMCLPWEQDDRALSAVRLPKGLPETSRSGGFREGASGRVLSTYGGTVVSHGLCRDAVRSASLVACQVCAG